MKTSLRRAIGTCFFVCVSPFLAIAVCKAADRTPEQILPPSTQVYARWDGIAAHQKAYDESARGKMFAGETGKAFDELQKQLLRQVKLSQSGASLLDGKLPEEVGQMLGQVKAVAGLPKLLAETGIVAAFEVRPPGYDLGTLYNLVRGDAKARGDMMMPQFLFTAVIPDGAGKPGPIAALRLFANKSKVELKERVLDNRKITAMAAGNETPAWYMWNEGKHLVVAAGNMPLEKILAKIKNDGTGITNHELYKRLLNFKEFHVVTRGFIDVKSITTSFDKIMKAYAPEAAVIVDALGGNGITAACFWDGFDKEQSHGVLEIDVPGPRKGLTKVFKPAPFAASDLPPLPADLTRFTAGAWISPRSIIWRHSLATNVPPWRMMAPTGSPKNN